MRRPAAAALLLLAVLAPGGCGGKSTLSARELRTQASAICVRAANATARVAMPSTADEGAGFLREGLAAMRPELTQLRVLKAPATLRGSYANALQARAQELALIARHLTAIAHGEDTIASFQTLQTELDPLTRMEDAAWRAAEIPSCLAR
jgi:hypothetical protein